MIGWGTIFSNLKIKYKIFILIALLMASVILITNLVHRYAFYAYDELMYEQSSQAISISSLGMENELKKIAALSFNVVTDPDIQDYLWDIRNEEANYSSYVLFTKIRQRMVDLGALDKYVLSFNLYDINDKEYTVGSRPITLNKPRLARLKLDAQNEKGGIAWTTPDENDRTLTAVRSVRRFQNLSLESLGMLAVRIDVNRLFSDYATGLDRKDAQFIIINSNHEMIYPDKIDFDMQALSDISDYDQGYKIVRQKNNAYFISYRLSAYTDWTYVTIMPYNQIFHSIVNAKNIVLAVYIILFFIAVIVAFQFSRRITDPLERLTLKMRRVQLGNFDYQDEETTVIAMDEVGQIQRHFRIMLERINELIKENYVKQLVIKDTQFKALQAQINPHFLYNTLESINWMAKMSNQSRISQMVESLGFLLRLSINDKDSIITLERELEIINHYLVIQKLRFEERLEFTVHIPQHLLSSGIPKLSVQPLVENAVNYALEPMIEPCSIIITATDINGLLMITVEDNGPGMSDSYVAQLNKGEVETKGTGLGLGNIRERILMLYGEEYGLHIDSTIGAGTKVTLKLPHVVRDEYE
ncbi:sensor histidine kinase [Paenibacillus camelliae]|uniref:sensor histidine kinase n=1 Tax=Paenibacillus camelliae TaxID=512410 RepID=UPI00203DB513|nr:histidine kinase [Paenibacillus camelliae]MCM3631727.1 sensor histidine kinase [Paenibacillus camelliae]